MSPIPALTLPALGINHCRAVLAAAYDAGLANPLEIDATEIPSVGRVLGRGREAPPTEERETIARFLYLNAVLDQGPDSIGVGMFLAKALHSLSADLGLNPIVAPSVFFERLMEVIPVFEQIHAEVKAERSPKLPRIRNYSLYGDQYRVTPWTAFRWGAVLGNIMRFERGWGGLLPWLAEFPSGEQAAIAVKSDKLYGLGGAIGEKASRLFVKWIGFTAQLQPEWTPNSYEVPLDANVGRVLMRTGYIFAFLDLEDMERGDPKPWAIQKGGKVNLSAQALNDRPLRRIDELKPALNALLDEWHLARVAANTRIMKTLNVLLADARGPDAEVGTLDDGFMHIGRNICTNDAPDCGHCPLGQICIANNGVAELKTVFYCGTGSNVFFR